MKKLFVTVAAALLAGAALAQMPDVKIENHQGDVINTSSLVNGKPTILSFWSTTCKPLPYGAQYHQRPGDGLA